MDNIQRSYYAIIPANVRYDADLSPNAKLLYGEITALCNERGYCWANNAYFAELYKVSKTSISKWIKQLVDKGYIHSQIQYKEGTKEILNRYITIVNEPIQEKLDTYTRNVHDPMQEKLNTPITEVVDPMEQKLSTPIEEKLKDNNTIINTTLNTTVNNTTTTTTNNTREKESAAPSSSVAVVNPFMFYQQNGFGMTMNDITRQKIDAWCHDLSDELVVHAMQIAIERNNVSWTYAEGILKNWHRKGVKSLADVEALAAQFEAQRAMKQYGNKRQENIPEWFGMHQYEQQQQLQSQSNHEPIDFEAERQKILEKLQA